MDRIYELLKGNASNLAKQLGVAPSTIGRWRENTEMIPLGMVDRLARLRGYRLILNRKERSFEL